MKNKYRCFFCDEVFTGRREAWLHFGEENCVTDPPACVDPLRKDESARMKEVRETRELAAKMQFEAERADDCEALVESYVSELRKYFGEDCTSVWVAGDRYRSALNRIADLEECSEKVAAMN